MKFSWSLFAFVFLPAFTVAVVEINDITIYKPCFEDSTVCPGDQVCFKYFCYPKTDAEEPLKSCWKNRNCPGYSLKPKTQKCLKEGRRGVCVHLEDYEMCESHEECEDRGGKCCVDYCCNPEYFDAIMNAPCLSYDETCKVKNIITHY